MTKISVVCCEKLPAKTSRIVCFELDMSSLDELVIETVQQQLDAHTEREMHNAAHHETHGPVTYLQQVNEGGFFVYVGAPDDLQEHFFGVGTFVAFMDDEGPGHASKVGPNGVQRTLRILKGHLNLSGATAC